MTHPHPVYAGINTATSREPYENPRSIRMAILSSAHHEWFDRQGAHGPQYMTEAELPEHLRGLEYSSEEIHGQYESMSSQLTATKRGKASEEIDVAELGDLDAFIRQASRRQVVLDEDEAEAVVETLSGSGVYHHD